MMAGSLRGVPRTPRRMTVGMPSVMVTSPAVLYEAEIGFKKGLRGRFRPVFASLEFNALSVFEDSDKRILLNRFSPPTSWISSSSRSESGLFIVNVPASEDSLYLFETGNDLFLQTWLRALSSAGWKSALAGSQSQYSYVAAKSPSTPTEHQEVQASFKDEIVDLTGSTSLDSSNLNGKESISLNNNKPNGETEASIVQPVVANSSSTPMQRQRSQSLPLILPLAAEKFDSIVRSNDRTAEKNSLSAAAGGKTYSANRAGVSVESGYCSKESLLMDGEKSSLRNRMDRTKAFEEVSSPSDELAMETEPVANYEGIVQEGALFLKLDKMTVQGPNILSYQQKPGADSALPGSPTSPLTPSPDRSAAADISATVAEGGGSQGVKLEKKQSMSQIFSQLKNRFGTSSTRKKGKKAAAAKKTAPHDTFSSRLLWNPNGHWKDKWFVYQDGVLSGYKDVGFKPAEIALDLKSCKLTCFSSTSPMKQLNLFKLTTSGGLSHFFLAWSDDTFETWLEILCCLVRETAEFGCSEGPLQAKPDNDSNGIGQSSVNPLDALPNIRTAQSQSSENSGAIGNILPVTDGPVTDGLDSGNDGDESGLDSSTTSAAIETYLMRSQQQRERMRLVEEAVSGMMAEASEPEEASVRDDQNFLPTSLAVILPSNSSLMIGQAKRQESKDSTSTSASTTDGDPLKSPTFSGDAVAMELPPEKSGQVLRVKRPTLSRHRHSCIESDEASKVAAVAVFARPHSNGDTFDTQRTEVGSCPNAEASPMRPLKSPVEKSGAISASHSRVGSQDSTLSENVWDALVYEQRRFGQKASMGSEDDDNSVHSRASDPFDDEKFLRDWDSRLGTNLPEESKLRDELLLRKRRNSLTLERGTVQARLQALRSSGHGPKHSKSVDVTDGPSASDAAAVSLTNRLEEIDSQIDNIDMRIHSTGNQNPESSAKKGQKKEASSRRATTGGGFMTRFRRPLSKSRLSPNGIDVSHYVSVESLASTASRDSHRDSPKTQQKHVSVAEKGSASPKPPVDLRYTRAMSHRDYRDYAPVALDRGFSQIDVDDGVEYPVLDRLKWKSMPGVVEQDENHNTRTMDALQKIEDFEKFSAILSNQIMQKNRGDVIDV